MRKKLIALLQAEDRNGCYSDEDALLEFGRVWTLSELRGMHDALFGPAPRR